MSEGHHEMLFDLEPAEATTPAEFAVETADDSERQGAFDIGIAIPEPFTEPGEDAVDDVEEPAVEVGEEVLQNPETAPRKHPNKGSFYQETEDSARLRGAVLKTMIIEGRGSVRQSGTGWRWK